MSLPHYLNLAVSASLSAVYGINFYNLLLVTHSANIYYLKMINTEHDNTNLVGGDPPLVIFGPQITTFPPLTFSCLIVRLLPL